MAVSRAEIVEQNFLQALSELRAAAPLPDLDAPVRSGVALTAREALRIYDAQVGSRLLDLIARELKGRGEGFYTIGSSGHEGNAAVAAALEPTDPAFLHYRSGGFFLARAAQVPGPAGAFDVLLGMLASSDEPIAGGRHKVFGSLDLAIPPQTSTIASHLPKALGTAVAMARRARRHQLSDPRIVVCTFGDASSNHASAATTLNAAAWTTHQNVPAPVLFVCEDNGIGISVRTPQGWIARSLSTRPGVPYWYADGLDLVEAWAVTRAAAQTVRRTRRPGILHLRTVRLLGHAGSDVEQLYRTLEEIIATEAHDPLLASARLLVDAGAATPAALLDHYHSTRARLEALAEEALRRPRLSSAGEVVQALYTHQPAAVAAGVRTARSERRLAHFGGRLPENEERPRPLAFQLNRGLADTLLAWDDTILFGEDVGRKGGVYHVTAGLTEAFGVGRVFNTLLDETTILGLAIGAGHAGLLPIPEIQYLAYLMNAVDQLRGEAGSLQFFSAGQYANPMVVRVAGLAYQKGFGGHFHNDNGIAAVREIPGVLLGCPARGDDAVRMLRTMVSAAATHGRVSVLLEPIALYHTKDLHTSNDGGWLTPYPPPGEHLPVGEVGVYGDGTDLCIATYANGLFLSLRVARHLAEEGLAVRVIDLRWLQPLPHEAVWEHASQTGRLLIVDECRANSGVAAELSAEVGERARGAVRVARVTALDTYIPLGAAADLVLVSEADIERGARALLEER